MKNTAFMRSLKFRYLVATGWALIILAFLYGSVNISMFYVATDRVFNLWLTAESDFLHDDFIWQQQKLIIERPLPKKYRSDHTQLLVFSKTGELLYQSNTEQSLLPYIVPEWLDRNRFEEIELEQKDKDYFIGFRHYLATDKLPYLIFATAKEQSDISPEILDDLNENFHDVMLIFFIHIIIILPLIWLLSRWSLKPINKMNIQLQKVKENKKEQLDTNVASELKPLVESVNDLVMHEREQKERQRKLLSDLSHGLKTPLSVLLGVARSHSLGIPLHLDRSIEQVIYQEVENMVALINLRLKSASAEKGSILTRESQLLAGLINQLVFGMHKIYATKDLDIKATIPAEILFWGHRNDLLEVVGNLLDNACKYGKGIIHISAYMKSNKLYLVIEDNGFGVAEHLQKAICKRGIRLDSQAHGYGLGISIAVELLTSYQGELHIERSSLGGAKFIATFSRQESLEMK